MMLIRVKVRTVDLDGFLGRDRHPHPEDVGQEGWVTNLEATPDEDADVIDEHPEPLRSLVQCFYVALDNGRKVQLMGHEIELVSCVHDGDL